MPALISGIKEFIDQLSKIPRDIQVNITTNQSGGAAGASTDSGGSGGGGGGGGGSSDSGSGSGGISQDFLSSQSNRADLRTQGYAVGQNNDGSFYAEKQAAGGSVRGGVPYLVGEMGLELYVPDSVLKMASDMLSHPSIASATSAAATMPLSIGTAGPTIFTPPAGGYIVPAGAMNAATKTLDQAALHRLVPRTVADAVTAASKTDTRWLTTAASSAYTTNHASSSSIEARAMGGLVSAGKPYLVGEQGPEVVMPNAAGMVHDASTTKAVAQAMASWPSAQTLTQTSTILEHLKESFEALPASKQLTVHLTADGQGASLASSSQIAGLQSRGPSVASDSGQGSSRLSREDARMIAEELGKAFDDLPTPSVSVDDVHQALLRKRKRNGTLGLS